MLKGLRGRNEEEDLRNKRDVSRSANDLISEFKVGENDWNILNTWIWMCQKYIKDTYIYSVSLYWNI